MVVLLPRGWNESLGCRWKKYQQRKRGPGPLLIISLTSMRETMAEPCSQDKATSYRQTKISQPSIHPFLEVMRARDVCETTKCMNPPRRPTTHGLVIFASAEQHL